MAIKKNETVIEVKPIEVAYANIRVVGDTPLIMHKWSTKAKRQILDAQMKTTKTKPAKVAKSPVEDFIDSMYWMTEEPADKTEEGFEAAVAAGAKWGFPATSIKSAAISSAYRNGITKDMVSLRGLFFIEGEGPDRLVEIKGVTPVMREDMVRVGMGVADIRFRGEFPVGWYADLKIAYNINGPYTLEQIINLVNLGGFSCGIGEWRPEKEGDYGRYHVAASE